MSEVQSVSADHPQFVLLEQKDGTTFLRAMGSIDKLDLPTKDFEKYFVKNEKDFWEMNQEGALEIQEIEEILDKITGHSFVARSNTDELVLSKARGEILALTEILTKKYKFAAEDIPKHIVVRLDLVVRDALTNGMVFDEEKFADLLSKKMIQQNRQNKLIIDRQREKEIRKKAASISGEKAVD